MAWCLVKHRNNFTFTFIPPLPQYVFIAWCLVKHRDNFTFTTAIIRLYYYMYRPLRSRGFELDTHEVVMKLPKWFCCILSIPELHSHSSYYNNN